MELAFIGENHLEGVKADCELAVGLGFVGLEFNYWGNFADLTEETVIMTREILDTNDVRCAALGLWGWNHLSPDATERARAHEMLNRAIDFAEILEADTLITGGGSIPDASLEETAAEFVKVFPPFLDRMEESLLTPAFYAVHGASFFACMEAYERVWEHLPQVTIKFDPANWRHHGDDYLALLRQHGDRIGYVHLKEHLYMDGELASQPPIGMGDIEWGKVMAFLYEHGYDGYLSVEPHGPIWSRAPFRQKLLKLTKRYISQFLS
jgi:sugar phosphate isomerase/epimerase